MPYYSAYPYFGFPLGHAIQVDTVITPTPNAGPHPVEEGRTKSSPPGIIDMDVQNRLQIYSFNLPMQPTSNQGIGGMDGPPFSEHSFPDIRDNGLPVGLRGNYDATYDPQISVVGPLVSWGAPPLSTPADVQNRPQMYSFNPPMQSPSNQGIREMDGPPLSEHPFPDIRDNGFPVASLGLRGNSDLTYDPQTSVNRPQIYYLNPLIQPTSNQSISEMDGPPLFDHSFPSIRDNGLPVASLGLRGNSDAMHGPQISVAGSLVGGGAPPFESTRVDVQNRPPMYSSNPSMQPPSNQAIGEMDGPPLSDYPVPSIRDNGLSLDLRGNSDATYGPQISVTGSLVAPPFESTVTDVQNRPQIHSFNPPIPPTLHIIPRTPPPMQRPEESEPQDQPHQPCSAASPERPADMDEALKRPFLCDSCDKRFTQRQGLNRHRRTHSPSWCIFCDATWSRSYQYRDHLEKDHPDVDADTVLGKPTGSIRRAAIMARDSQQQPKLSPLAVAKPV
jgi:hypothetical protein